MKAIIIIFTIVLYFVYVISVYYKTNKFDNKQRLVIILFGLIIMFFITFILVATIGINLVENETSAITTIKNTRTILIFLFAPINGIILIPYAASLLNKYKNKEIQFEEVKKKIVIAFIVFLIILLIERGYIVGVQEGMVNLINLTQ